MTDQTMSVEALAAELTELNARYRAGTPLVSDEWYDSMVEDLRRLAPDHPFLQRPEPEPFTGRAKVRHPFPMLSTEKAYSHEDVLRWAGTVKATAAEIGMDPGSVSCRITPKLDGMAARYDGTEMSKRGDGEQGEVVTHLLAAGLPVLGGSGLGELAVSLDYFNTYLSDKYAHPRNFVTGTVDADEVSQEGHEAIRVGALAFVNYNSLSCWKGTLPNLLEQYNAVMEELAMSCPWPIDGWVIEVRNQALQEALGATSHHYRWQLAFKVKGESKETTITNVLWQVGRTGQVTPVLEVQPTQVSGAVISRITAHHAGMVRDKGLVKGTKISIIRSGEVIPKFEGVVDNVGDVTEQVKHTLPTHCPSCSAELSWSNDFLMCTNTGMCPAQTETALLHFFNTMGNVDLFGPATISTLVKGGFANLPSIYAMQPQDFWSLGYSDVMTNNLLRELKRSRTEPVNDWRFLAAIGIPTLGKGDSRRLLAEMDLNELFTVTEGRLAEIEGFGRVKSAAVYNAINGHYGELLRAMLNIGFTLTYTPSAVTAMPTNLPVSPFSGKAIVFTGKMSSPREQMEERARQLGARVQSGVSKATDILVVGENAGSKLAKAKKLGVQVMTEQKWSEKAEPAFDGEGL